MCLWFIMPCLIVLAVLFYALLFERYWIAYERLHIPVSKHFVGGLTLLHLSDTHFKRWNPRLMRVFRTLGETTYDLILITGDIIDDHRGIEDALKALGYLRARHGIYCVFGNHDYLHYSPLRPLKFLMNYRFALKRNPRLKEFRDGLSAIGVQHLGNRSKTIGNLGVTLVGIDDFRATKSRMDKVTKGLLRENLNILIAHNPDALLEASPKWFDLALCGHTHGGQIRLPFLGPLFTACHLPRNRARGQVRINGIETYISSGLGTTGITWVRFLCRPMVTQMVLMQRIQLLKNQSSGQFSDQHKLATGT